MSTAVCLHGLETSEHPARVLEECWRVLGPGRQGAVHRAQPRRAVGAARRTPFGFGRPYSLSQLEAQLKRHHFVPERHLLAALYQPPSERRFWLKTADAVERLGARCPAWLPGAC
jgi:hypothetical protein